MAYKRIAVETGLSNVRQILDQNGYEVVNLDPVSTTGAELHNCDAFVITGLDRNLGGYQDVQAKGPVIDASGMTPLEVLNEVKSQIG